MVTPITNNQEAIENTLLEAIENVRQEAPFGDLTVYDAMNALQEVRDQILINAHELSK